MGVLTVAALLSTGAHAQSSRGTVASLAASDTQVKRAQLPELTGGVIVPPGSVLEAIWLVPEAGRRSKLGLRGVHPGEPFSAATARQAMRELLERGEYAAVRAEVELRGRLVGLLLHVEERKVATEVDVNGGELPPELVRTASGVVANQEVTHRELAAAAQRIEALYREHGFPTATASGSYVTTDDPLRVGVTFTVAPGAPQLVESVEFIGVEHPLTAKTLERFAIDVGDRLDKVVLEASVVRMVNSLRELGFVGAVVSYAVRGTASVTYSARTGPQVRLRFEGMQVFDVTALRAAAELGADDEWSERSVRNRLYDLYERHGYYDTHVRTSFVASVDGKYQDWVFTIREGKQLKIAARYFPCLSGDRDRAAIDAEIDGVLGENLPGADTVVAAVDPGTIDEAFAKAPNPNPVVIPTTEPWTVYSPVEYEKALAHLRDLYRSEGYLSAVVGPTTLLRRACDPSTGPGLCRPLGQRQVALSRCPLPDEPIPVEDAAVSDQACEPDPSKGVRCEPVAAVSIPVKLGPKTFLWDVEFLGNQRVVDKVLLDRADLELGQPVSQAELQRARRRLGEYYADQGFAFADVEVELELSEDHTRGKAKFVISEREPVTIRAFSIRGAERTLESLILGRMALQPGELYRRDLARQSEEQLGTLGVFSSVTVELEDPEVPAREKTVLISVEERPSKYIDVKPGFSTGEGARASLELGHRNLFGRALQLRFRFQVGYLPDALILDSEVRRKFSRLDFIERLERRNSVTLELPVAQRFRLSMDGIDVRDNQRDFGLTKRALVLSLAHRPGHNLSWVTGASIENNDVTLFNETETLDEYLESNPQFYRLLNVPQGRSFALAFRLGGAWDGTDNPFGATKGVYASVDGEPVIAFLDEDSPAVELSKCESGMTGGSECEYESRFVKLVGRIAGYIPFNNKGLSLALSVRVGANVQMSDTSVTYTDRLFFFGGSDSLRGHLQDSVVPEDLGRAAKGQVVVRGGDFVFNPRAELRIPLNRVRLFGLEVQTALFVDAGNLWRDIDRVQPWILRYTAGTGLRLATPVGPLALDYGFRLDRRPYESDTLGAFNFSVGLF
jgi:outer membrane protein insertion porin family